MTEIPLCIVKKKKIDRIVLLGVIGILFDDVAAVVVVVVESELVLVSMGRLGMQLAVRVEKLTLKIAIHR